MTVSTPKLELVIDFVNTRDLETGQDELEDAGALGAWLQRAGLLEPGAQHPTARQQAEARTLREALRALMLAHNGGPAALEAGEALDRAAQRGRLSVRFGADGSAGLEPRAAGVDGALAALLIPVAQAGADGSWSRVKACAADDCHWAFYDKSRNRSGRWCDMAVCGNRTKVRTFRDKRPG